MAEDFNADGHIDLAVVNQGVNSVSIFLGKGDGTFGTRNDYATGTLPSGIAEADFNQDGFLDLAISNQTDNTVSILLGNGDGTFGAQTTFPTDTGPTAILTGDFNGDGIADLITANQTANDASVLIGSGNGAFTDVLNAPTANAPVSLATGDFNGDTLLDLAVADQSSNTVTVLLNSIAAINALTGNLAQTAYPSAQFEDIGLKVKVTPRIHPDNDVTLQLSFDISSLSGTSVNGIPVIGNRQIEQTARLRAEETTVLSGIIDREDIAAISGLPGNRANCAAECDQQFHEQFRGYRADHRDHTAFASAAAAQGPFDLRRTRRRAAPVIDGRLRNAHHPRRERRGIKLPAKTPFTASPDRACKAG